MRKIAVILLIITFLGVLDCVLRYPIRGIAAPGDPRAAQESPSKIPITGIQVVFTCDKVRASMANEVVFDVAILNVGKDNAYLYDWLVWGEGGGLLLYYDDGKMKRFRPWIDPPYLIPPNPDDPGVFVRLNPGRLYGLRERWPVKDIGHGPGKYSLWIEYEAPVIRENVYNPKFDRRQIPAWYRFQGVISNKVAFEVVR